jgi:hypothetical protein
MGKTTDYNRVEYARRASGGGWTVDITVPDHNPVTDAAHYYAGGVILGASDKSHFAYDRPTTFPATALHRSLQLISAVWTLGTQHVLNSTTPTNVLFAVAHPIYYDDDGTERIVIAWGRQQGGSDHRHAAGGIDNDTTVLSEANVLDASIDQNSLLGVKSLAVHGKRAYLVMRGPAGDLFYDSNNDDAGWGTDAEHRDLTTINAISANVYVRAGRNVLAMFYDNNGTIQYDELDLGAAGAGGFPFYRHPMQGLIQR